MTLPMQENFQDKSKFTKLLSKDATIDDMLTEELGPTFAAYRRDWQLVSNLETVTDFPLHIAFELNHSCNLACPMCPWSTESKKNAGKSSWFDFDTFKAIIDEGVKHGLRSVGLDWVNEPLIRKDLPKFAAYARQAGILDVLIHTNGMLLDEAMARGLIEAGATRLMVSLDAHSRETYDKIRIGGDLEKVKINIFRFLELRTEMDARLPLLSVNFVRMSINEPELHDFMEFWKPHVDFFAIQELINPFPDRQDKDFLEPTGKVPQREFHCAQPYQRLTITYEGDVMPCCTNFAPELTLGNIKNHTLKELWDSPPMSELRLLHKEGRYLDNPTCARCVRNLTEDADFVIE